MEGGESPLDVLSRAATMMQENQALTNTDESSKQPTQKQTTKWRRDRRSRLPEYSRKSDPKFSETFGSEPPGQELNGRDLTNGTTPSPNGEAMSPNGDDMPRSPSAGGCPPTDTPLDMSVRQRGLPPSYAQTISNPGYRSSYRPSVIQNGVPNTREELPSGISMCDPIIDEHFRRSLGSDYHAIFQNQNNNSSKDVQISRKSPPLTKTRMPSPPPPPTTSVVELMDSTGLSVDEHFAKALGDTWTKLNRKEQIKGSNAAESLVST